LRPDRSTPPPRPTRRSSSRRRTRNATAPIHRTQKKRFSFSRSLVYHSRILKTFSYLYQVEFVTLLRLLLSVQAFAFRGRLMSLLAPARGMSTLPAKGGFSRPSLKPVPASSSNASKHASSAQGSKEAYPSSTLSAGSH